MVGFFPGLFFPLLVLAPFFVILYVSRLEEIPSGRGAGAFFNVALQDVLLVVVKRQVLVLQLFDDAVLGLVSEAL